MHHKIVALDAWHVPIPPDLLRLPEPHSYEISLCETKSTSTKDIQDRVKDATIIAVTLTPLDASTLSAAVTPNLRLVVVIASGTDGIDKQQCKERGIRVLNVPNANTESVANHVLASYFACRRRLTTMHHSLLNTDEWKRTGTSTKRMHTRNNSLPLSCREEVVGIIGYGAIGQRVAQMCRGLGMTVLIASRKQAVPATENQTSNSIETRDSRTPFTDVLRQSSVIVLCLPRNPETINMISNDEFQTMSQNTILINITRGGIIDEHALLKALKDGMIDGCATDVFLVEPSGAGDHWREGDSPVLKVSQVEADEMNLLVTPHVAWYSAGTIDNYLQTFKQNVENWCSGELSNVIV
ncbi:glycerate dehydrogenase [Trichoderma arundinaceum]|uniref:Glycerate dehydrogenase n=1 Tax=Trichoderma arundinaceum TaxID=490622 RepID=A0A395NNK4_TRIAR|nr:glycerate dehydrogenase [Trichoderma arundinaceum]